MSIDEKFKEEIEKAELLIDETKEKIFEMVATGEMTPDKAAEKLGIDVDDIIKQIAEAGFDMA